MVPPESRLIESLVQNWKTEMEGAATYRALAERESEPRRRDVLLKLAAAERRHANRWEARLKELGVAVPPGPAPGPHVLDDGSSAADALLRVEAEERKHIDAYRAQAEGLPDEEPARQMMLDMARDEQEHARTLRGLAGIDVGAAARARLESILRRERWHVSTGSWLGDAIYGVNDGLGAVFGIVSTVAGYTSSQVAEQQHFVLVAGLAGTLASALSMGSGAYLATKSELEVHEAEVARERREMEEDPEEEREEMELFYQLKGFSAEEAKALVARLESKPEQMLKTMVAEELGISEEHASSPIKSAISSSLATAVGAIVPVLPFFFFGGVPAIVAAAVISLSAHFAVGAAKTIVTTRPWWVSGAEMTVVGAVEGAITFVIGLAFGVAS